MKVDSAKRGGSHWLRMKSAPDADYLPVFLSAGNIKPFINNDLAKTLARRRLYRQKKGGTPNKGGRHPQFFAGFIRKYVYTPLADSKGAILEMLDEKNPIVSKGKRKYKMFQFLSEIIGLPAFRAHLWQVVGILGSSRTKAEFDRSFNRVFPASGTQVELLLEGIED